MKKKNKRKRWVTLTALVISDMVILTLPIPTGQTTNSTNCIVNFSLQSIRLFFACPPSLYYNINGKQSIFHLRVGMRKSLSNQTQRLRHCWLPALHANRIFICRYILKKKNLPVSVQAKPCCSLFLGAVMEPSQWFLGKAIILSRTLSVIRLM